MKPGRLGLPPAASQRLEILDLIRGFTLGGIFFANILWFNGFQELTISDREIMQVNAADHVVLFLIRVLVNAKFYHIFAFLFGLGFALQLLRAAHTIDALFPRRMLLLLLLGVAHSLLWWGDILRYYALVGFTLLWFRKLSNQQLVFWIIVCSVLPLLSEPLKALWLAHHRSFSFAGIAPRDWLAQVTQSSLGEMFGLNFRRIGDHFIETLADGRALKILAMFLAGMLAGRLGIFSEPQQHARLIRRVIWPSFWVGILGNLLVASSYYERWGMDRATVALLRDCIGMLATPALSLFYVSVLLYLGMHPPSRPRLYAALQSLVPAGRMALTNYLLQTVVAVSVFWPPLGGQYASLSISQCSLLVVLVFGGQILLSRWWLARYHFGPLEWLWRSGTHGRWQALRR